MSRWEQSDLRQDDRIEIFATTHAVCTDSRNRVVAGVHAMDLPDCFSTDSQDMATLADDFRFQRPRAGYGSGRSGYEGDEAGYGHGDDGDDEEEEEDPLFGDGGAAGGANGSSYRSYFSKGTFEDKDDDRKGNAKYALPPRDNERQRRRREGQARDATSGPSSDENSELYAVLNLEKDASNEDVLKSYRTLAVAFQWVFRARRDQTIRLMEANSYLMSVCLVQISIRTQSSSKLRKRDSNRSSTLTKVSSSKSAAFGSAPN